MRAFLIFLGVILGALLIAGFLAYPAWLLVTTFMDAPIHRVMHRIAMLLGAIGLYLFLKRLHLANQETLGYAMPSRSFIGQMLLAFACGLVLMSAFVVALFGLDVRDLRSTLTADGLASIVSGAVVLGIARGFAVAFIEETFFRGALFSAIRRESGVVAAVALPSLIYAAVHFLGGGLKIPADEVTYAHSLDLIPNLFEKLAAPHLHIDSFAALFVLGVLLSLIRLRTGAIAGSIGMHAAGVCVITVTHKLSIVNQGSQLGGLVGSYDGILGWLAFLWFVVIVAGFAALTRPRASMPNPGVADGSR